MADQTLTERCHAMPHVLSHCSHFHSAEHRFARAVDCRRSDLRVGWSGDDLGFFVFFFFFGIDYRAPRGTEPHVALLICMLHA